MSTSGNALAKLAIVVTSLVVLAGIIAVAIMLGQSKELRDANPKLAGAVAYGSAYVLPGAGSYQATGVALETGTIAVQDAASAGKYDASNVVQFFSKDPTKTVVNYNDKVRVFFPLAGLWYTTGGKNLTDSFDAATDVTIAIAPSTGPAPTAGPIETGYPVLLFENTPDLSDEAFKVLSQSETLQIVPAAVFGAAGFAGA